MTGVILDSAAQAQYINTGTITGAYVSNGDGILAEYIAGVTWNVTNTALAQINTSGLYSIGVSLPNGSFNNQGYVSAGSAFYPSAYKGVAVEIGVGVVNNDGGNIVSNGSGVVLGPGGGVVNNTHYGLINTLQSGVSALGRSTINNMASVASASGVGVALYGGGSVTNGQSGESYADAAGFDGVHAIGYLGGVTGVTIQDATATSTVTNFGLISGNGYNKSGGFGIYIDGAAIINNGDPFTAYATVSGYVSAIKTVNGPTNVYNYAFLKSATGVAVDMTSGYFDNLENIFGAGSIQGAHGGIYLGSGTVTNSGVIAGGVGTGVRIGSGVLANSGRVDGGIAGVELTGAGVVDNTGTIVAGYAGVTPANVGVMLDGGGAVYNYGLISGPVGASITGGTLVNQGTIIGTGGVAVEFNGDDNRMVLEQYATVTGSIFATLSPTNLLELGPTLGVSVGTLTGLGSTIAGFQSIEVDPGGTWAVTGSASTNSANVFLDGQSQLIVTGQIYNVGSLYFDSNTPGTGGTMTVAGSLQAESIQMVGSDTFGVAGKGMVEVGSGADSLLGKISVMKDGVIIGAGTLNGPITDRGEVVADGGVLTLAGAVGGAGILGLAPGATLIADKGVNGGKTEFEAGGGETLEVMWPAAFKSTLVGFGSGDGIDLLNHIAIGESFAGGVLTVEGVGGTTLAALKISGGYTGGTFNLASDGDGGTLITYQSPGAMAAATRAQPLDAAVLRFADAMASAASVAADLAHTTATTGATISTLATPRPHAA